MQPIKQIIRCSLAFIFLSNISSCHKKEQAPSSSYTDIVAQDPSYRLGKWYSVTDSGSIPGYNHNTRLDTIWFINDSLAGWTSFGGNPYVLRTTYFPDPYDIVYLAPNPLDTSVIETSDHQCGMTQIGDTFIVYWDVGNLQVLAEHYVKISN